MMLALKLKVIVPPRDPNVDCRELWLAADPLLKKVPFVLVVPVDTPDHAPVALADTSTVPAVEL